MYKQPNHDIENERADKMRRGTWTDEDEKKYLKETYGERYDFVGIREIPIASNTDPETKEFMNYDEAMAAAASEINTKYDTDLQDKIDAEQSKVTDSANNDEKILVDFDVNGKPTIKSLRTGLQAGNVNIKWVPDQKCIKPEVTVNEFATKDEILQAVRNAEYAYMACKESIETISQICAPLTPKDIFPENPTSKEHIDTGHYLDPKKNSKKKNNKKDEQEQ